VNRRAFVPILLTTTGGLLALGGASAIYVRQTQALWLGTQDLDWLYLVASVGAVALAVIGLCVARLRSSWPFEPHEEPPRGVPFALGALLAGAGAGMFGGLLNHLMVGNRHVATAMALLVFAPAALLALAVGAARAWHGAGAVLVFAVANEVSGQLGIWIAAPGPQSFYRRDLTQVSLGLFGAGLAAVAVAAGVRALRARPNIS
jgi:hypothetical protein